MLTVTTEHVEGKRIKRHLGIVTGEAILGANIDGRQRHRRS